MSWSWTTPEMGRPLRHGVRPPAQPPGDVGFVVACGSGFRGGEAVSHALRLCGARTALVELEDLPAAVASADGLVLPGGCTFGDALGPGRAAALRLRPRLLGPLADLVARGGVVLGLGNGFQILVHLGLLPGGYGAATLAGNASGAFETRWVHLRVHPRCTSPLLTELGRLELPVRCGAGRIVLRGSWDELEESGQLALQYTNLNTFPSEIHPVNPTGSPRGSAGLCDATGRILGMMAHPEDHLFPWQHPDWPRFHRMLRDRGVALPTEGHGLEFFRGVVRAAGVRVAP